MTRSARACAIQRHEAPARTPAAGSPTKERTMNKQAAYLALVFVSVAIVTVFDFASAHSPRLHWTEEYSVTQL